MDEYQIMQQHLNDLNSLPDTCATFEEAKRRQKEYLNDWLRHDPPPTGIQVAYDEEERQYVILDNR